MQCFVLIFSYNTILRIHTQAFQATMVGIVDNIQVVGKSRETCASVVGRRACTRPTYIAEYFAAAAAAHYSFACPIYRYDRLKSTINRRYNKNIYIYKKSGLVYYTYIVQDFVFHVGKRIDGQKYDIINGDNDARRIGIIIDVSDVSITPGGL